MDTFEELGRELDRKAAALPEVSFEELRRIVDLIMEMEPGRMSPENALYLHKYLTHPQTPPEEVDRLFNFLLRDLDLMLSGLLKVREGRILFVKLLLKCLTPEQLEQLRERMSWGQPRFEEEDED